MAGMSMVLLSAWAPKDAPSRVRLYVHGLNDLRKSAKVWIEKTSGGGWRLMYRDPSSGYASQDPALKARVCAALRAQGQLSGLDEPSFATLAALAANRAGGDDTAEGDGRPANSARPPGAQATDWRMEQAQTRDLARIKIPGPVEIVVDHREPDDLAALLAQHPMARVTREALTVGDVAINRADAGADSAWRILVERKDCRRAPSDFDRSITQEDRRLFYQVEALSQTDALGILLLEGDVFRNSTGMRLLQEIDGFLTFASVIQRVSVIPSLSLNHSAYILLKLSQHERYGLGYSLGLRPPKPKGELDAARFVLEGLPGVNAGLAKSLIEAFGSVRAVINASAEDLMRIPGIGPQRARRIVLCVRGARGADQG